MQYLKAPWRAEYFGNKSSECPFCARASGVVASYENVSIMMNKYPYSQPHLLIIPHEHVRFASELSEEVWLKMCSLARKAERILRERFGASGVNIGLNLGAAAGAGIEAHIHMHVLARWAGDTNFITTTCQTRVLALDEAELIKQLKEVFNEAN